MIASTWWKVSLGLLGVTGLLASSGAGCGSSTSSSSSTSGSDTTSATTSGTGGSGSGTGGAGTGGDTTTSGTSAATSTSAGSTSSTGSTTSSTGTGMVKYETCSACTDLAKGAPADECNTAHDACFANKNCVQLYDCAYVNPGCNTDPTGACCTFTCYETLKKNLADPAAAQVAIDLYHAYDACLYCTTCTTQCDAQSYCAAYAAGPAGCTP